MKSVNFKIDGMTCSSCSTNIGKAVKDIDGVKKAKVSLSLNYLKVDVEDTVNDETIINKVSSIGYKAEKIEKIEFNSSISKELKVNIIKFSLSTFITLWLWIYMILMLSHNNNSFTVFLSNPIFQLVISTIVIFGIGYHFFVDVFYSLKTFRFNMSLLVVLGSVSSFVLSVYLSITNNWENSYMKYDLYYEAADTIISLVILGKILESLAKNKTSQSLNNLTKLIVKTAYKIDDGKETVIDILDIKIGDILLVKPGDYVPVDGQIIDSVAYIDESMLTGESMPVKKGIGDEVFGSTLNTNTSFKLKVTKNNNENLINKIINLVQDAQATETKIQKTVDKISSWFVPIVIVIAIITFTSLTIYGNGYNEKYLVNSIVVLIVSCPCALGLASPTAMMVGTSKASALGILFKDADFIEKLAKINVIAFDKTGTLTIGKPLVEKIVFTKKENEKYFSFLKTIESNSTHPLAKSIVENLSKYNDVKISNFESVVSFGVTAKYESKKIKIGKPSWFKIDKKINDQILSHQKNGKTVVVMSINDVVELYIVISDQIKDGSIKVIEGLKKLKIESIMLTGDNKLAANYISNELKISKVHSELSIEDKANIIDKYKKENKFIAMIGDGTNDILALTKSDVGIALNNSTDVAIESSDVVLLKDDIENILLAIKVAKKTLRKIKTNLFWAFIYNIITIPIAAFGLFRPEFASLAMALSSVSVVINSLLLKIKK